MAATGAWYISTTNSIHLVNLKDEHKQPINNPNSVIGQLQDDHGNVIAGGESITFTYVQASNGNFDGELPPIALKAKVLYHMIVTVINGGKKLTGRISLKAQWFQL